MRRKFTQQEVQKVFEDNGCKLIDVYQDARTKLRYICECGEISYISLDNFKKGRRCKQCGLNKLANQFRTDIEEVKQYFIDNNCTPLFDEYINNHKPLKYICECGGIGHTQFSDFKDGKRCGNCRVSRIQESFRKTSQSSKPQIYLHSIIGGTANYPLKGIALDIAFPDEKIHIEYDGGGHDLGVRLGRVSKDAFLEKEARRWNLVKSEGWKEIRIISIRDKFPTPDIILTMIDYAKNMLLTHSRIIYDLDNGIMIVDNEEIIKCNFGELKNVKYCDLKIS